jgi:chromosome condensin MukBEF MukE localization factor
MVRRLFWLAMGVTIGALVVRKLSQAAQRLTPSGLASNAVAAVGDLADSIGDFAASVRRGMDEREAQLRSGSGLDGALGARPEDMA